jgi:hypothetical protein
MKRSNPVLLTMVVASLAAQPSCAHRQLTNGEVAVGVVAAAGLAGLIYLGVQQCHKGPAYCQNTGPFRARSR